MMPLIADCVAGHTGPCNDSATSGMILTGLIMFGVPLFALIWLLIKSDGPIQFSYRLRRRRLGE